VKKIETALLAFWRLADPSALGDIAELGNGLEFRIKDAAMTSSTFEELERNSATKSYTSAKIRRAILFGALGVTKADLASEPHCTTVLAANKIGREILSSLRKEDGEMVIVTKPADAPACRQSELSARADALYTLALPTAQNSGYLTKKKIYME
jgi:predicted nucleotidyltransferase